MFGSVGDQVRIRGRDSSRLEPCTCHHNWCQEFWYQGRFGRGSGGADLGQDVCIGRVTRIEVSACVTTRLTRQSSMASSM